MKLERLRLNDTNDLAVIILRNCFLISVSMILFKSFLDALFSALSLNDNFQASIDDLVSILSVVADKETKQHYSI
jgi:hypothetical protein